MRRPSAEAMSIAAQWLSYNTGDAGEMEACQEVAAWLEAHIQAAAERAAAREVGCAVARLRERMRALKEGQ